jgi:hypothetical protein
VSVIATAVRHLMAAGVTGDALLTAIEELEASVRAEPKPRSAGAIRQERYVQRKRQQASEMTENDVGDDNDVAPALSPSPNEINSNPHPHTHPEGVNAPARKAEPLEAHVEAWLEWRQKNPFPRPWWADKQVWADWMKVRSRKGGVNTITAHNGFLADVAKHADAEWPPGLLLSLAVSKSWLSINRPHGKPANARPQSPSNDEIQNPYARVAARREAERSAAIG